MYSSCIVQSTWNSQWFTTNRKYDIIVSDELHLNFLFILAWGSVLLFSRWTPNVFPPPGCIMLPLSQTVASKWVCFWALSSLVYKLILNCVNWITVAYKMCWYLVRRIHLAWPSSLHCFSSKLGFLPLNFKISLSRLEKALLNWVLFHLSIDLVQIDNWWTLHISLPEHGILQC